MQEVLESSRSFLPELLLVAGLLLVVLVDASGVRGRHTVTRWLTLVSLLLAFVLCLRPSGPTREIWGGMLVHDPVAVFFKALLVLASLLVVLMFTFESSRELRGLGAGEFHALMLAVTVSSLMLAAANDLAMLYLALEMVSITSYVLVAYLKGDRLSNEASLKYILFGAVSTGGMLYGLSLLYGVTGTTALPAIRDYLAAGLTDPTRFTVYLAALLVFAGFGFKTAAVPFHFWCPDVYQGAPTPVTAFLSVAPKAAGFAVMLRFFSSGMAFDSGVAQGLSAVIGWPQVLMVLSVATMTVGNIAALTQTNMKRLLAYSSIAHAGYIMMGVVALSEDGTRALMVYLMAYLVMNLGAFLVVTLVHAHDGTFDLRDYPGLYRRAPLLTIAMSIFMLSLIGIPPFVGFLGKLYVFGAIVEKGPELYWYAVAGAINAAVAAFYYARVLKTMIIDEGNEDKPPMRLRRLDLFWVLLLAAANTVPLFAWSVIHSWAAGSALLYARM
jgi:NADH-quinone oxidoreductase subunit N